MYLYIVRTFLHMPEDSLYGHAKLHHLGDIVREGGAPSLLVQHFETLYATCVGGSVVGGWGWCSGWWCSWW